MTTLLMSNWALGERIKTKHAYHLSSNTAFNIIYIMRTAIYEAWVSLLPLFTW